MTPPVSIYVLSDIHYAAAAERQRGLTELEVIRNPFLRTFIRGYRYLIWKRDPFAHNHRLGQFIPLAQTADYVVANGDYSCDTAFVGVSDDAAFESAQECLTTLRTQFGPRLRLIFGDHELGKMSLAGGSGGMRLASWHRARQGLGLEPYWTLELGRYLLVGVTSSLLALPVFEPDTLPHERLEWEALRRWHVEEIRRTFQTLRDSQRVLLFCHDPTALPFLWRDDVVRPKAGQIEATIIGHLHSELFLRKSYLLSGMPPIRFLGNSICRMSTALHDARLWRQFKVRLCPALAGIELLRDGGYCRISLDPTGSGSFQFERCHFGGRQNI